MSEKNLSLSLKIRGVAYLFFFFLSLVVVFGKILIDWEHETRRMVFASRYRFLPVGRNYAFPQILRAERACSILPYIHNDPLTRTYTFN
jgi:hypothetical protein